MKKTTLFITLILLSFGGKAQSVKQIEDRMMFYLNNIQKWSFYNKNYDADTLDSYNERLLYYLNRTLKKQPLTLRAEFKRAEKYMNIVSSDDHKFRIYSWDTEDGGTMRFHFSIIEYQTNSGVKTEIIYRRPEQKGDLADSTSRGWPGFYYSRVFTVYDNDSNVYYLAIRWGIFSSSDVSSGIKAYKIKNDHLNDSVKIFRTSKKFLNSIDYGFDTATDVDEKTGKQKHHYIHLSKDKHKLYIPVIAGEHGTTMTDRNLVYVWDGYQFVFDKNEK